MTDEASREVFIKNIPYEITENDLSKWCSEFGPITKCVLKRDKLGNSRGFAFVTYATIEGHNNILSKGPHTCNNRSLLVKSAYDQSNSIEDQSNYSPDQHFQVTPPNENFQSNTIDTNLIYDDDDNNDNHNHLAILRDELDANIECMQIAHEHEIKILREKILREKKLRDEAEELYKEAEEDWRKIYDENRKLRTSLIKNVMQTFSIRKDFARRTKDQLKKCNQIEKQSETIQSNRIIVKKS